QIGDLLVGAFHLHDQQRRHIERIAGLGEVLADVDRRLVHEFDGHRYDASSDDGGDALAGGLTRIKAEQHWPGPLRGPQDGPGRDAELALGADDQSQEIVPRRIQMRAADLDHLTVHQHYLQAEDIVGRHAVFEAVRAARVHADVAGERTGELARRVGRVEEAPVLDGVADAEVGDADLHARHTVHVIDLEHAAHARHA